MRGCPSVSPREEIVSRGTSKTGSPDDFCLVCRFWSSTLTWIRRYYKVKVASSIDRLRLVKCGSRIRMSQERRPEHTRIFRRWAQSWGSRTQSKSSQLLSLKILVFPSDVFSKIFRQKACVCLSFSSCVLYAQPILSSCVYSPNQF
jgi:hypothetical protein